jgi:hypothetical protein
LRAWEYIFLNQAPLNILGSIVDLEMLYAADVSGTGHIARVCKRGNKQNNFVEQKLSSDDVFLEEELFTVFDVNLTPYTNQKFPYP